MKSINEDINNKTIQIERISNLEVDYLKIDSWRKKKKVMKNIQTNQECPNIVNGMCKQFIYLLG
jgi:EAL domain-containing protein (putative c-di-GMP-specific phosphodiesterase class I)